jgi:hypothetical protein
VALVVGAYLEEYAWFVAGRNLGIFTLVMIAINLRKGLW